MNADSCAAVGLYSTSENAAVQALLICGNLRNLRIAKLHDAGVHRASRCRSFLRCENFGVIGGRSAINCSIVGTAPQAVTVNISNACPELKRSSRFCRTNLLRRISLHLSLIHISEPTRLLSISY